MPKITKEAKSDDEKIVKKKATTTKKTTAKKKAESKPKKATTKKVVTSTEKIKKETAKKGTSTKAATTKKATTAKKTATKKVATSTEKVKKETAKKSTSTKKATATKKETEAKQKKATTKTTKAAKETKSTTPKRNTTKKSVKKVETETPVDFFIPEYYDLPYNYNKTVVKLLAQTPNTLFVYWEISDNDRKQYVEKYGDNFFEVTKPVLIVHNVSNNYSFEVDINDFANCWYLNINDSQCEYKIELGRKPIKNYTNHINEDYIYVSSSNEIEAPNDRILFDQNQKMAYFRNVKTNNISSKSINLSYMKNMGKIYNIYDIYKKICKDENIEELDLSNPSSKSNPSSTFK